MEVCTLALSDQALVLGLAYCLVKSCILWVLKEDGAKPGYDPDL